MTALLSIRQVEKPWGKTELPPPFRAGAGERIGEIWFEPPPALSQLLVKYIFTSEKLSVQVHPSDAQTRASGLGEQGKEECWLVIDAEPGAKLGIGFRSPLSGEAMRAAALDGRIEHLLEWHSVTAGDFFYIPANTVHAIGAGISLIEVQQNSDITYRLFDYGRPRELHLDEAIAVADGRRYSDTHRQHVPTGEDRVLVDGPLFRLDQCFGAPGAALAARYPGPLLAIPRDGPVRVSGEEVRAGQCALVPALADLEIAEGSTCLIAAPA